MPAIAAVVVTYNRLNLLKECINALRSQTYKLDAIIVVNNDSKDRSKEWLDSQSDLIVIHQENLGGAGGFHNGMKFALSQNYDWIWTLDVDIIPQTNALQELLTYSELKDVGFLSSLILHSDGSLARINIPYLPAINEKIINALRETNQLAVDSASFGSTLFNTDVVRKVGLPISEFFIWGDDVEFTMRIVESRHTGYLILSSIATHHQPDNSGNPLEIMKNDLKAKYAFRNTVCLMKLRNRFLGKRKLLFYFQSLMFVFNTINARRKRFGKISLNDIIFIIRNTILGIIFNPRKHIKFP